MTPKTRHDELKALLSKISEESVSTSDVLADIYDLLRERLPEPAPADDLPGDRRVNVTITDVYAAPDEHGFLRINVGPEGATVDPDARNVTVTDVPDAPADDLPGEPVEPCPECHGKAGVHSCGCWADEDMTYECAECAMPEGGGSRRVIPWPCPTAAPVSYTHLTLPTNREV